MCDTFVVTGSFTADGSVIFGKNTDREPNEAHELCVYPAADHAPGSMLTCTYLEIPQVQHTYAVLLAKPFWMWGAEIGLNEHGVAIGNEAIFTRIAYEKTGLTGMDLLRLALERSKTALEALQTITALLERHGQGGNCGFTHPFYYHNSYILADPREAWVLETAGRHWVAEKVQGIRTISNAATIGAEWDLASPDLVSFAVEQGWCKSPAEFHFARCYSDFLYSRLSGAQGRQVCTTDILRGEQGRISVRSAMQALRAHPSEHSGRLDRSLLEQMVCMHAGAGPVRNSQSVGSLVAHLTPGLSTAWATGTSAPCISIFKPVWLDAGLPLDEPAPTGQFDPRCLWWRHESLHRSVLKDYSGRAALFQNDRDDLEASFLQSVAQCPPDLETRRSLSKASFETAESAEQTWLNRVNLAPVARSLRLYYKATWNAIQRQARMDQRI